MAVTYKKKMILVGMMLLISCMGLFLVISTDEVKNENRIRVECENYTLENTESGVKIVCPDGAKP